MLGVEELGGFIPLVSYARIQDGKHSQEIAGFQAELAEARTQLQHLQKQLDEQLSRQPLGNQEVTEGWLCIPGTGTAELDAAADPFHPPPLCAWQGTCFFYV